MLQIMFCGISDFAQGYKNSDYSIIIQTLSQSYSYGNGLNNFAVFVALIQITEKWSKIFLMTL